MQYRLTVAIALLALMLPAAAAAQQIPFGTTLPIMLSTTLDAAKDQPGRPIAGRTMQDVLLPDGSTIPRRSRVIGHVVSAAPATANVPSRLVLSFDRVLVKGRLIAITTHLRALASMHEVFEAKMPTNAIDDYGTSPSDWNTVQVGGAGVYRGSGQVVLYGEVVGRATDYGAVTARLIARPKGGCNASDTEQALWIFSPSACGVYGFADLTIARSGKNDAAGAIELQSSRTVRVSGGSGWLLKTQSASVPSVQQ